PSVTPGGDLEVGDRSAGQSATRDRGPIGQIGSLGTDRVGELRVPGYVCLGGISLHGADRHQSASVPWLVLNEPASGHDVVESVSDVGLVVDAPFLRLWRVFGEYGPGSLGHAHSVDVIATVHCGLKERGDRIICGSA